MSLQWTFVATFLYAEIILVILFLLPFISPTAWQRLFRSRLLAVFRSYANIYFNIFIIVLIVLFLDAIRDVRRYTGPTEEINLQNNPAAEAIAHMKLFRSQRNFYIAGFALFLFMVLRRMVTLISSSAQLYADCEAAKRQAQSATAAAQTLMDDKDKDSDNDKNAAEELSKLKKQLSMAKDELEKKDVDLSTLKKQAASTDKEYDRLLGELAKLQGEQSSGDKKGD